MEDRTLLIAIALIAICVIEIVALVLGHNGSMAMTVFVLIGGLVGYVATPQFAKLKK